MSWLIKINWITLKPFPSFWGSCPKNLEIAGSRTFSLLRLPLSGEAVLLVSLSVSPIRTWTIHAPNFIILNKCPLLAQINMIRTHRIFLYYILSDLSTLSFVSTNQSNLPKKILTVTSHFPQQRSTDFAQLNTVDSSITHQLPPSDNDELTAEHDKNEATNRTTMDNGMPRTSRDFS